MIAVLLSMILLAKPPSTSAEILQNGNFALGLDHWDTLIYSDWEDGPHEDWDCPGTVLVNGDDVVVLFSDACLNDAILEASGAFAVLSQNVDLPGAGDYTLEVTYRLWPSIGCAYDEFGNPYYWEEGNTFIALLPENVPFEAPSSDVWRSEHAVFYADTGGPHTLEVRLWSHGPPDNLPCWGEIFESTLEIDSISLRSETTSVPGGESASCSWGILKASYQ